MHTYKVKRNTVKERLACLFHTPWSCKVYTQISGRAVLTIITALKTQFIRILIVFHRHIVRFTVFHNCKRAFVHVKIFGIKIINIITLVVCVKICLSYCQCIIFKGIFRFFLELRNIWNRITGFVYRNKCKVEPISAVFVLSTVLIIKGTITLQCNYLVKSDFIGSPTAVILSVNIIYRYITVFGESIFYGCISGNNVHCSVVVRIILRFVHIKIHCNLRYTFNHIYRELVYRGYIAVFQFNLITESVTSLFKLQTARCRYSV